MRFAFFVHSLRSCWNNGHAHFLRGVAAALIRAGHQVTAYEAADGWSRANLLAETGSLAASGLERCYPAIRVVDYADAPDLDAALADVDAVLVHEWNPPALVKALGERRRRQNFVLLFHDSHHRSVSEPETMARFDLDDYDGVLAFGATIAEAYRRAGWARQVFVWHEAADHLLFRPGDPPPPGAPLVFIGNWGDEERSAELETFLIGPAEAERLPVDIHGVRYPAAALARLAAAGARYRGWLPNVEAPDVLRRALATVHVPRRYYAEQLPGIPTIRVFEALACGTPLISAPWQDNERLFRPGDYLTARDAASMRRIMRDVAHDSSLRAALADAGPETILARHTCAHRAGELVSIVRTLARAPRHESQKAAI